MGCVGEVFVRSGFFSGSRAPAATATARYTEYEPACVPMTLRCALLVTVPMSGPRTAGSSAPHTTGIGLGPCPSGCDVSWMVFGCFFLAGLSVVMTSSSHRARPPSAW